MKHGGNWINTGELMPHKSLEKCIYCGAETQLYVNARPVCPERLLDIESSRAKAAERSSSPDPDLPRTELIDAIAEASINALKQGSGSRNEPGRWVSFGHSRLKYLDQAPPCCQVDARATEVTYKRQRCRHTGAADPASRAICLIHKG